MKKSKKCSKHSKYKELYNLTGDTPSSIAEKYQEWNKAKYGISYKYSIVDGWSTLKDGCYRRVRHEERMTIEIRKYLAHCYRLKDDRKKRISETTALVKDILNALKALTSVNIPEHLAAPSYLGRRHVDMHRIIALDNGVIDASKFPVKQRPLSKYFYILDNPGFPYDPRAKCPQWRLFLSQIFEDDVEGDISIKILQEFFGLFLTRITKHQKILCLIGQKRSGKSTVVRMLQALIGLDKFSSLSFTDFPTHFGLQSIIDKTVAAVSDAAFDSKRSNVVHISEILKKISGEDPIAINRKYQTAKQYTKLPIRFLIVSNAIQGFKDVSGVLASRFIFIVTTQSFYGRENKNLTEKLLKELPGILNWALRGLRRLERRGYFLETEKGKEAKIMAEKSASDVISFVDDWCIEGKGGHTEKQTLYRAYSAWAIEAGSRRLGRNDFYREFQSAFPVCASAQQGAKKTESFSDELKELQKDMKRKRVFKNIRLRPEYNFG